MKNNKKCKTYLEWAEFWLKEAEFSIQHNLTSHAERELEYAREHILNAKKWVQYHWYFIHPVSFY